MYSQNGLAGQLTANDVSNILNLICPRCGGPLGGEAQEFKCQGRCRTDWRRAWDSSRRATTLARSPRARALRKNGLPHLSAKRHPWRAIGRPAIRT